MPERDKADTHARTHKHARTHTHAGKMRERDKPETEEVAFKHKSLMQSGHLDATPYVIDPNKILWTVQVRPSRWCPSRWCPSRWCPSRWFPVCGALVGGAPR